MGDHSAIEWTDATWNPETGCTKVSAGCEHCYAERLAFHLQRMGVRRYRNGFTVTLQPDALELPLHWETAEEPDRTVLALWTNRAPDLARLTGLTPDAVRHRKSRLRKRIQAMLADVESVDQ